MAGFGRIVQFVVFLSQVGLGYSTVHTERHQFKPKKPKHVIVKQHKVARGPLRRHEPMTGNLSSAMISTGKQVKQVN